MPDESKVGYESLIANNTSSLKGTFRQHAEMGDIFKKIKDADDPTAASLFIENVLPR